MSREGRDKGERHEERKDVAMAAKQKAEEEDGEVREIYWERKNREGANKELIVDELTNISGTQLWTKKH